MLQELAQILNTGNLMQTAECFKILNVSPGEDWHKVRKSYHSLAKQFHPDINPGKRSDDSQLKEINRAFEKLERHYKTSTDILPDQRVAPDKWASLFEGLKGNPVVQRVFNSGLDFLVELDSRIFQLDIQKDIKISESVLQKGASLHLKSGKERFEIKVPSGDWNQMSLRIPGKGEGSLFFRRRGDLVLNLSVPVQKIAKPENSRFSYEMKIRRDHLARVMTLNSSEGPIQFSLPGNTRDGQSFTLRSRRDSGTLHVLTVRLY